MRLSSRAFRSRAASAAAGATKVSPRASASSARSATSLPRFFRDRNLIWVIVGVSVTGVPPTSLCTEATIRCVGASDIMGCSKMPRSSRAASSRFPSRMKYKAAS